MTQGWKQRVFRNEVIFPWHDATLQNSHKKPSEKMTGWVKEKDTKDHLESFLRWRDGWNGRTFKFWTSQGITPWQKKLKKRISESSTSSKQRLTTYPCRSVWGCLRIFWSNLRTLPSWNFTKAPAVQRAGLTQCCLSTAQGQTARPKPRWLEVTFEALK